MDEMKVKLTHAVASKLAAAPQSGTKDELIEELSDNLYRRFLDMAGAGVPEEEAFNRALDDLGDVDELLAYLGVEAASDVTIDRQDGQSQSATINTGAAHEGQEEAQGGVHYDYHADAPQSDLDAIFANVSEVCRIAMDQVKEAAKQAKDAIQRRTTVEKDNGHVKVHFNTVPEDVPPTPPTPPVPPAPPTPPTEPVPPRGWEFEAELDSDEGRFFAGGGPKEKKDVIYGFGYDKAKGGFFAQWGEYKGEYQDGQDVCPGPRFSGQDAGMSPNDDGSYSVTALKDLRGIEVYTTAGDVTIHVSEAPDAGVIIDGDVDELDVTCSADGVLTIREGRTASSSFFSRRGFCSADVELFLPRRYWEMVSVTTASGDVDIDREGLDVGRLTVSTGSGDFDCRLRACGQLHFKSGSGDLDLTGSCTALRAETASGDVCLNGQFEDAHIKTASGDIELDGLAARFLGHSMSGDVRVESSELPQVMELSSKSGEVQARIPDAGSFSLRVKTVSGEMHCDFPMNYINGIFIYGDGAGPAYSMTTVSGDVTLDRY